IGGAQDGGGMKSRDALGILTEAAPLPALARDAESSAEECLRRHCAERDDDAWLQPCQLRGQPHAAGLLLRRVGAFVQPELPPQLVLEMLHRVGQVKRTAFELRFLECPIEQTTRRTDERQTLDVLLHAWLLADQHDARVVCPRAEHGLCGVLPQSAGTTLARLAPERREAAVGDLTHGFREQ